MTKEIAQLILQFMNRVQLNGAEVPAFNASVKALSDIANPSSEEKNG